MFKQLAIAASLAVASSSAFAQQAPSFYVGADYGTIKADGAHHKHGYGAYAGYNLNANFAVEAGFHRLSKTEGSYQFDLGGGDSYQASGSGKAEQSDLSVIGTLPLSKGFSVYGRLGINRLESKATVTTTSGGVSTTDSFSESETKVLYGAGLTYAITTAIAARFEVQKPHNEVTRFAIGVSYRF